MTKVLGQQQFSQLWNQFQSTNSHLFQGGGQLKSNLSTGDVQQLLTTVTQDSPDDAQLYGVHRLMNEHAGAFGDDDLEVLQLELAEHEIDFLQFMAANESEGLANAAKRFASAPAAGNAGDVFIVETSPAGHEWDFKTKEGIHRAFEAIAQHHYPNEEVAVSVERISTDHKCIARRYGFGGEERNIRQLLYYYRNHLMPRISEGRVPTQGAALDEIKKALGYEDPREVIVLEAARGKAWDLESKEGIHRAFETIAQYHFPDEEVAVSMGRISTVDEWMVRRFDFGGEERSIWQLVDHYRKHLLPRASDGRVPTPGAALGKIKKALGYKDPREVIVLEAARGEAWDLKSKDGIHRAFEAIAQHHFPDEEVAVSVGRISAATKWTTRRYDFNGEEKNIRQLADHYRRHHLPRTSEGKVLTLGSALGEIKKALGYEDRREVIVLEVAKGKAWDLKNKEGIHRAFEAIAQHHFPDEEVAVSVGRISTDLEWRGRRYDFGGEEKSIRQLVDYHRKHLLPRTSKGKVPTPGAALGEIKKALGCENRREVIVLEAARGEAWDLKSKDGIHRAFEAIARQLFPGEAIEVSIGRIAATHRCTKLRFDFGSEEKSINQLLFYYRKHLLPCTPNGKIPTAGAALDEIKKALGYKDPREVIVLEAARGEAWDLKSKDGIHRAFEAIAQHHFPDEEVAVSVGRIGAHNEWKARRYDFNGEEKSINQLLNYYSKHHLPCTSEGKVPTQGAALDEIKKALGYEDPRGVIVLEAARGKVWDLESKEGIHRAFEAIAQHHFPDEEVAVSVGRIGAHNEWKARRYDFDGEEKSIWQLVDCYRKHHLPRLSDGKVPTEGVALAEIRRVVGGLRYATEDDVREFASRHKLDPVISLLSGSPSRLRDFLEVFFADELDDPAAAHLVRTFSGLKLYTEIHQPHAPKDNLDILIGAMLMRQDRLAQLSAHDVDRALRLLQYVMGRHFESDLDVAEALVSSAAERQDDQRMKDLLAALSSHYRTGSQYSVSGIKTDPFLYQRLGVQYLVDNDSAILADDPGLGKTLQALAAAEKLREMGKVKKVVIVAPARVKSEWEREIAKHLKHVDQRKIVKIEGDAAAKSKQVKEATDADYIILNYEFLRGKTPEELAPILENLDLLIADEAQKMSNPSDAVQQAEAVRNIEAPRKWLLTATPYYSHPEHVFSLLSYLNPGKYGSFKEFREAFTTDVMGLRLLYGELAGVMLRRSIAETLGVYEAGVSMEQQGVRMPRKDNVPLEEEGYYDLSRGQVELLRELSQDIRGWMVRRGYSKKMTHFTHLQFLYHATVDPALLGEDVDSPLYDELDRVVMKRLAQGKKVLIYAHHQEVVRRIMRRYEHLGAVQFNGDPSLKDAQKEANLNAFETNPDVRIMVAGIESGGTGLNIKAADVIVNVERTLKHSAKIQSEGRPQRLSPESPKESYEIVTLVPRYPKELIETEADPAFREFMEQGTVSEILEERLADLDRVYRLVMDGLVAESDAQKQSKKLLVQGFSGLQKVDIDDIDTPRRRKAFAAAGAFYQLWDRYPDDRPMRARIQQLATLFHKTTVSPQGLANALADVDVFEESDFDWLMSPFSESNKYLRDAAVQMLSPLIKLFGEVEWSLSDVAGELALSSSKVARVVLPLMTLFRPWENEKVAEMVKGLFAEIEELPSSTRGQALTSLMVMATSLGQSGNGRFRDFVLRNARVFGDEDVSIIRRTTALERLALFRELSIEGYEEVVAGTYADIDALSQALKERQWQTLANEFGLEWDDDTETRIAQLHGRWGDFRPLMGLLNGMQRAGDRYRDEVAQLKEVFVHAVRGDLREWRNEQAGDRTSGNKIEYLAGYHDFWRRWSQEDETRHDEVIVEAGIQRHILGEEYEHLVRLLQLTGGEVAQDIFSTFARSGEADRKKLIRRIEADKRVLAKASRKRVPSADDVEVAWRYGVGEDDADLIGTALRRVNRLFKMLRMLSVIVAWSQGMNDTDLNVREVINVLRQMALGLVDSVDAVEKQLREQFDRMRHFLEASGKERKYENVRVYDTDDPNIIMRLGALTSDMINCFNYHGNPSQNHVLTGALGSRNFRVVVIEVNGRIRAVAPVKVRKTDDEHPVIFLERGLFSGRYNFEREMLEHLEQKKARRMDQKPLVARQIMKPRPEDVRVHSTGSYSKNEYAEALFGVRESDVVYHSARIVFDPRR